MPNFTFPRTFKDGVGEVASGAQVMENFTVLKEHIETLEAGAWTSWSTLSNKVEENPAFYTVRVRTEAGAVARLRGVLLVKAGEEVKAGESVMTLPAAFRPTKPVSIVATSGPVAIQRIEITTAGLVIPLGNAIKAGENLYLDGLSWSIT